MPPTPTCSTCPPTGSSTAAAPRSSPTTSPGTSPRPGERVTRSSSAGSTTTPMSAPGSRPRSEPESRCAGSRSTRPPPSSTSTPTSSRSQPRTRLVAVTAASNVLGTKPPLRQIADRAHAVGALVYVDGVHYASHHLVDVPALGADLFVCSPYKFLGPHCGVLAGDPELLESLNPDKLRALSRRRAGAVRARHPPVRDPGRRHCRRRLPRRDGPRPCRHPPRAARAVVGSAARARDDAPRAAAGRARRASGTRSPCTPGHAIAPRPS